MDPGATRSVQQALGVPDEAPPCAPTAAELTACDPLAPLPAQDAPIGCSDPNHTIATTGPGMWTRVVLAAIAEASDTVPTDASSASAATLAKQARAAAELGVAQMPSTGTVGSAKKFADVYKELKKQGKLYDLTNSATKSDDHCVYTGRHAIQGGHGKGP